MPASFPDKDFAAFTLGATSLFPGKQQVIFDPEEKRRSFIRSAQAVRYRYRSCVECDEEFKGLCVNLAEPFKVGWGDEGSTYELERCIYLFFTSALSVFDSFAFCLYFVGNAVQAADFPNVAKPRDISLHSTAKAFKAAFPQAPLTALLITLKDDARFKTIYVVRNLVGHRLSGCQSMRFHGSTKEEIWHLPASPIRLKFDSEMLQHRLEEIGQLLAPLISAAREFVENHQPAMGTT